MIAVKTAFKPAWWCRSAHAQTVAGVFTRRKSSIKIHRKRVETPDGDFLDLDYLLPIYTKTRINVPQVVIFHGLEGSSRSPYVQSLLGRIQVRGWAAVAVNMRGCSGEPNRLQQTYHAGKTEDVDQIIRELSRDCPVERLCLVGYSLGGNMVLKWLGEQSEQGIQRVGRAVAISVPYQLRQAVQQMDQGFNREVYTRALLNSLKKKVVAKRKFFPDVLRYDLVMRCNTFRVFDQEVTAMLNGFQNAETYWAESSCQRFLSSIRVPTLLIHANDDPFFPGRLLPFDIFRDAPFLQLETAEKGGHVGFVSGHWPWKSECWLEERILDFFAV